MSIETGSSLATKLIHHSFNEMNIPSIVRSIPFLHFFFFNSRFRIIDDLTANAVSISSFCFVAIQLHIVVLIGGGSVHES